jgi:ABC-type polysaccharide transport system permease subunit
MSGGCFLRNLEEKKRKEGKYIALYIQCMIAILKISLLLTEWMLAALGGGWRVKGRQAAGWMVFSNFIFVYASAKMFLLARNAVVVLSYNISFLLYSVLFMSVCVFERHSQPGVKRGKAS